MPAVAMPAVARVQCSRQHGCHQSSLGKRRTRWVKGNSRGSRSVAGEHAIEMILEHFIMLSVFSLGRTTSDFQSHRGPLIGQFCLQFQ